MENIEVIWKIDTRISFDIDPDNEANEKWIEAINNRININLYTNIGIALTMVNNKNILIEQSFVLTFNPIPFHVEKDIINDYSIKEFRIIFVNGNFASNLISNSECILLSLC